MSQNKNLFFNNISSLLKKRKYVLRETIFNPPDNTLFEFIIHCTDDLGVDLSVYSCKFIKFNVRLSEKLVNVCTDFNCSHAILIYNGSITGFAKKVLLRCVGLTFEIFSRAELQFDITSHILQPFRFTKTTLTENLTNYLPLMKVTDPIARYFFFTVGDIIEIERRDGTVGYRRITA